MLLSDLKTGESGIILKVNGSGAFRKRIVEMGFIKGKLIKAVLNAPLKDPVKYKIMNYEVSLRRNEACLIEIEPQSDISHKKSVLSDVSPIAKPAIELDQQPACEICTSKTSLIEKSKVINVAFVGNPNAGKTTLFNLAAGAHEHVGNYSGVTVDAKLGVFKHGGYTFRIVDLPGTYSLSAYSPEELYVRKHIINEVPDVIVNIVAASNLERNLFLTTELIDLGAPVVIALNMYDELLSSGSSLDYQKLSELIHVPIVPTVAKSGKGLPELFDRVISLATGKDKIERQSSYIYYGNDFENAISRLVIALQQLKNVSFVYPYRYIAVKLIERDRDIEAYVQGLLPDSSGLFELRNTQCALLESKLGSDTETLLADAKYNYIGRVLSQTYIEKNKDSAFTQKIDKYVTHKYWGFPIFLIFMMVMFECTFHLGGYFKDWIQLAVDSLGAFVKTVMPDGMLKDLLSDGIIAGVGGVIVFLPNILILYAFISFMEDSGYMARAAFIMDRIMNKIGLHGKSFIPLVMGFGCNVPAIMSTRTIESRSSRMVTILISPFMSCSARLPVYLLFVGIFFKSFAGLALFGLYFVGILLAVLSALLFKKFLFPKEDKPFVMELPPYRVPTLRSVFIHMWDKSKQYLKKMGGIILLASILIWFLGYFPRTSQASQKLQQERQMVEKSFSTKQIDTVAYAARIHQLDLRGNEIHQENSFIGHIGKFIEPVIRPLGFDWKIGVGLISGMAAKEVIVSTFSVLYADNGNHVSSIYDRLRSTVHANGTPVFTPLVVIGLLLFILIYFPCIATLAAIKGEAGSWKWGVFSIVYTTLLAWVVAFAVYQIGLLL